MNRGPEISVVVPLYNEAANVQPLVQRLLEALPAPAYDIELLLVDDASTDDTWREILRAQEADSRVHGVRHATNRGQSAALFSGFRASQGRVIATLDGDLQNDPADLPRMLAELGHCDMVCGVRMRRADSGLRRFSSRVARWARKLALRIDFADTGCNLRVFKREVLEALPGFRGVHRFMPVLACNAGAMVKEIAVAHHPRSAGRSKYGVWNRLGPGIFDLWMVAMFLRRQLKVDFQKSGGSVDQEPSGKTLNGPDSSATGGDRTGTETGVMTRAAGACPSGTPVSRLLPGQDEASPARNRPRGPGDRVSRKLWYLDFDRLCAQAMRRTGLEDFGSPPLKPLPVLLQSLEHEAELHPLGRLLMRIHLRSLLETRLRLIDAWKLSSGALERQRLERPVFIVGMPRSGSTFLHELLAADPDHRAVRVWEVMYPLAAGEVEPGVKQRHIRKAEACLWWFRRLAPGADAVYPMRALTPHECVAIQSYTFLSEEFISTCRVPAYEAFLHAADLAPAYAFQKRFLQHLQLGAQEKRWVLKSPDHVYGLEALFSVFPDAYLIQTHRNPIEVLKSSADLTQVLYGLYGRARDPAETMARETRVLAENTERFIEFRDRHPELSDRIIDLKYPDLVADPLQAVRTVYERLGTVLDEAQVERVRQLASARSRYQGPRSSAAPFAVRFETGAEAGRFKRYCLRFGLPFRGAE